MAAEAVCRCGPVLRSTGLWSRLRVHGPAASTAFLGPGPLCRRRDYVSPGRSGSVSRNLETDAAKLCRAHARLENPAALPQLPQSGFLT